MRIGAVLLAIAVLHVVLSLVLFHAQVGLLLDRGVVMGASAISLLGACMLFVERRGLPLPASLGLGLLALAAALVMSMDRGGAPWPHSLAALLLAPFGLRALRRGPRMVGLAKRWPGR